MKDKDELYSKPDFSDEDGVKAAELESSLRSLMAGMRKLMLKLLQSWVFLKTCIKVNERVTRSR